MLETGDEQPTSLSAQLMRSERGRVRLRDALEEQAAAMRRMETGLQGHLEEVQGELAGARAHIEWLESQLQKAKEEAGAAASKVRA